jgi:hypothetical protein
MQIQNVPILTSAQIIQKSILVCTVINIRVYYFKNCPWTASFLSNKYQIDTVVLSKTQRLKENRNETI